jgi:hypothetical protein
MKIGTYLLTLTLLFGCSSKSVEQTRTIASENNPTAAPFKACPDDPQRQILRSNELQEIVKADQADRQLPGNQIDWNRISAADEIRAKRVAEIFAEGCFKEAKDYAAAALVFQHGSVPDHYYQAYLWSKRALDLGDQAQKPMVANAIDRYLMNLGYKQLFGAQSFWNGPNGCHCLGPTEMKFSDNLRKKICGRSLNDRIVSLREVNKENPACANVLYCDKDLKSPPKGMFPGIW